MSNTTNKVAKVSKAVALINAKLGEEFTKKQYDALAKGTRRHPSPYASLDLLREENIVEVVRIEEFEIEDKYGSLATEKDIMVDELGREICDYWEYQRFPRVREMAIKLNGGKEPKCKVIISAPKIKVKRYFYSINLDNYEKVVCRLYSQVKDELNKVDTDIKDLVAKREALLGFLNSIEVDEDTEFWDE